MNSDSVDPLPPNSDAAPNGANRREFLQATACGVLGAATVLGPLAAGVVVLTSPLRQHAGGGVIVKLTTLDALAIGAAPRVFQVLAERTDAWTRHPSTAVGTVFLERTGEKEVRAFNAAGPHLGCAVEWRPERTEFFCPCHNSTFGRNGTIDDPKSPSTRGLDALEVEIREGGEVWVKFQNFKAGIPEKHPLA